MPSKLKIEIPTPCHENWQDMTVADKGWFCASCQKHVIDFTTYSDRQIAEAFRKERNICGRFLHTQLNRDLVIPNQKSSMWIAASAAVFAFIGLGNNQSYAQNVKPETTQAEKNNGITTTVASINKRIIKGTVADEARIPIPGATIINKIRGKKTDTDFDGNFSIEAEKGNSIEISCFTMKNITIKVGNENHYIIKMFYRTDLNLEAVGGATLSEQ